MSNPGTVYPDTAAGAIAQLDEISSLDMSRATAEPDLVVRGVWKVTHPGNGEAEESIVYLAGYPNPWGDIREHNDFETFYSDEEDVT